MKFPEITFVDSGCPLCTLAEKDPNVLYVVHELFRKGVTGKALSLKVKAVFAERGMSLLPITVFNEHLTKHCAIVGTVPAKNATEAADDYETDYTELRWLYSQFRKIFDEVRQAFRSSDDDSRYDLVMLVKLASQLRQILKTLSDMRNNEKFFNIMLVRHTEQVVHFLSEPLGLTLRDIRDRLARGESPAKVREQLDKLLSGDIFPLFENAASQALEQSRQQYKLN